METFIPESQAAANDKRPSGSARPVKTFKQAGVEVSVCRQDSRDGKLFSAWSGSSDRALQQVFASDIPQA